MAFARLLRRVRITVMAGLIGGVTVGIGARLAMRVVALTDDTPGTLLTAGGTLGIVIVLLMSSLPLAVVYVAIERFLRGSDLRKGLTYGAAILVFPGALFLGGGGEITEIGVPALNLPMFASLFVLYGVVVARAVGWLERRRGGSDPAAPSQEPEAATTR